jgi:chromate reductase
MQYQMRTMAVFLDLHVLNKPEVCINAFSGETVFDGEGNLGGERELGRVNKGAQAFATFARATIAGQKAVDAEKKAT